jgi:hypothetical protein
MSQRNPEELCSQPWKTKSVILDKPFVSSWILEEKIYKVKTFLKIYTEIILALHSATTAKTFAMYGSTASHPLNVCGAVVDTCIGNALKGQIQNLHRATAIAP